MYTVIENTTYPPRPKAKPGNTTLSRV